MTAFLVNESRARRVDLSQDPHAHLWVTAETKRLWEHFAEHVTPHDDLVISLRHSFFLEQIKKFSATHSNMVLINVGSGFTSYPFLLPENILTIEVDRAEVIEYKQTQTTLWVRQGLLPLRKIEYHQANLIETADRDRVFERIAKSVGNRPTFVLFEGLTYFLHHESWQDLLARTYQIQQSGSQMGFDFWLPTFGSTSLFKKLEAYVKREWGFASLDFLSLTDAEAIRIPNYELVLKSSNAQEEAKKLTTRILADEDNSMVEHYRILQKQSHS